MNKKIIIGLASVAIIAGAGWFWSQKQTATTPNTSWRKAAVQIDALEQTVAATGTLGAVGTVDIGTQVSGIIDKIFVDFNDVVKANQTLAVLDKTALQASRDESSASLARSEAVAAKSKYDLERATQLFAQNVISEAELQAAQSTHASNAAQVAQAKASLRKAEISLSYTTIRSPINGTVISRNVEQGQTVAASLSTPTMFVVAEDLRNMEILADVDESDIGKIKVGQQARFTVQAYPDREFAGTVQQIRLQPQVVQNVVNYTVVLSAPNPELTLFPGMTATVEFIIAQSDTALVVPTAATNFRPPLPSTPPSGSKDASTTRRAHSKSGAPEKSSRPRGARHETRIWVERDGQLHPIPVKLGLSDDTRTALLDAGTLQMGDSVIVGSAQSTNPGRPSGSFNPMMMGGSSRRR